ncbi:hypothetical protein ACHAW6_001302 [Cyclotella cf. meneghiniana]
MSTSFPNESNSKTPSSSSPLAANEQTIGKECRQCLSFLTRALNQSGRPRSLLKALGVLPDGRAIHDDDNDAQTLYKPTPDGRGIALQLSHASSTTRPSPVSLQRRLTDAASRVVGGGTAAVLTTSPALESTRSSPLNHALHIPTAVTIECQTCGFDTRAEAGARAYVRGPDPLGIVLCSNRLATQGEVDEVLIHELIHVYDIVAQNMDLRRCRSLAYSEVRAARDAECSASLTSFTRNMCAKEKATLATKNMFPEEGRGCVCDVFEEAIRDVAPLGGGSGRYGRGRAEVDKARLGGAASKKGSGGEESVVCRKEARPSDR